MNSINTYKDCPPINGVQTYSPEPCSSLEETSRKIDQAVEKLIGQDASPETKQWVHEALSAIILDDHSAEIRQEIEKAGVKTAALILNHAYLISREINAAHVDCILSMLHDKLEKLPGLDLDQPLDVNAIDSFLIHPEIVRSFKKNYLKERVYQVAMIAFAILGAVALGAIYQNSSFTCTNEIDVIHYNISSDKPRDFDIHIQPGGKWIERIYDPFTLATSHILRTIGSIQLPEQPEELKYQHTTIKVKHPNLKVEYPICKQPSLDNVLRNQCFPTISILYDYDPFTRKSMSITAVRPS